MVPTYSVAKYDKFGPNGKRRETDADFVKDVRYRPSEFLIFQLRLLSWPCADEQAHRAATRQPLHM